MEGGQGGLYGENEILIGPERTVGFRLGGGITGRWGAVSTIDIHKKHVNSFRGLNTNRDIQ